MTDAHKIATGLTANERLLILRIGELQPVPTAGLVCWIIRPSHVSGLRQRHRLLVENPKRQGYILTSLGLTVRAIIQEQDHA